MSRIKLRFLACAVLALTPVTAFAVNCWNDCTVLATEWMHENEADLRSGIGLP